MQGIAMGRAVIGLGSNVGDRIDYLSKAVQALRQLGDVERCSYIYETPALLKEGSPEDWNIPYYNMAALLMTSYEPEALLAGVKEIESEMGRQSRGVWAPREIDLDILVYDNCVMNTDTLTLPHAELLRRDFALVPLAEVWPEWRHPAYGSEETAEKLAHQVNKGDSVSLKPVGRLDSE